MKNGEKRKGKILVIDDEELIRWSFEKEMEKEGYKVITSKSGEEGLEFFQRECPDLVILDVKLPGMNGLDVLKEIKNLDPNIPVIMITAYADVKTAVNAMKMNAADYISKPFDFEEVKVVVEKSLENSKIKREYLKVKEKERSHYHFSKIVTQSPQMMALLDTAKKVAESEATTVLIEGESGTGKELFARAIHHSSRRSDYPFMEINCAAIPETLLESELFGFEKGAFTDARISRKGLFELADGGTILLDEVSEMSLSSQAKLLRVLETKTFKRLGGSVDITADVRVIATTNKNLREEVKKGKFREDLFYRLNVIELRIPPLRERKDDIPLLVNYFIEEFRKEFKKPQVLITDEAMKILREYSWPGNVRELKNVIERVMILKSDSLITEKDLNFLNLAKSKEGEESKKEFFRLPKEGIPLEDIEKMVILQALEMTGGNRTKAAKLLSISRDTLKYRMRKYNIE